MEMLLAHPSIVAASVRRYWTSSWEKVVEEVTIPERLQLAEVMGLEKAQLESDKRALQFKLELVVSKEVDMKAKYEIELKAANECLKQARDQKRAAEASQKRAEEAQKLAEDRTRTAEITLADANNSLEAAAADNERLLSATKLELEKIKAKRVDVEARAVEAYQDAFVDTPEYQDLVQRLMTMGGSIWWSESWKPIWSGIFLFFARPPPKLMYPRLIQAIPVGETKALLVLIFKEAA
ncbi:hypothetical protein Adt_18764 [Abeliophyllum distichum]|uniref:Uncharacterized protein n=1 Tax=Abeliophyllum distichum TaxID=126358 RepID=A0ABD1TKA7_9LAMI